MLLRGIRARLLGLVFATVLPFIALMAAGLWSEWRSDREAAVGLSLNEARLIAAQVDDHIGNLENLLTGLSRAVSSDPADADANDALLRRIKAELPAFISHITVFGLDGNNIGSSWEAAGRRFYAGDRAYFRQVLAGRRLAFGEVVRARTSSDWVIITGRPVEDQGGTLRAVLAIGTQLAHFHDALRTRGLPAGSVIRIVNEDGIVMAQSANGPNVIGGDVSQDDSIRRHLAVKEMSEYTRWTDGVERLTGSSTAMRAPWLVSVGLPPDIASAALARHLRWGLIFSIAALLIASATAWTLSGRIVRPLHELGQDASTLAAGRLAHRSTVRTNDEVGSLAKTFNTMAASLQRRDEDSGRAADEIRQAKDTLAAVIDASPVAIICSDLQRRIVLWNRAAVEMFGYTAEEVIGHTTRLVPPAAVAESQAVFERAVAGEVLRDLQLKRMRKDGSVVEVRVSAAPMFYPDGSVRGVAWAYEDVTQQKRAQEQLKRLAHYDQLTSLPNRLWVQQKLGSLLSAGAGPGRVSIALFDLDGFKDVNDTLGHSTGDWLLVEVGHRLSEAAGTRGHVCRLGGDEFIVIIPGCGDPRVASEMVEGMLKCLADPFDVNDHVVHLGGSAGIAISAETGTSVDELIANADLALYQAKSAGGRAYRFFLPVLRAQAEARRNLDVELRRAFANEEFELYYQPQIRLADEAVVGAEALIRWRHPQRGILAPAAFIDALAESPIAADVGRWIIGKACAAASQWRAEGLPLERIGVNLFPCQSRDGRFLADIEAALRRTGLPADVLEIEITENIALKYEEATASFHKLQAMGVKLAFDDFGTGYASMSYLTKLPLSRIKIDRSFVSGVAGNPQDAAIVRSLVGMAHHLGLAVIAEGVETREQASFLLAEHCEEAQGFLFAKPMPSEDFARYLAGHRPQPDDEAGIEAPQRAAIRLRPRRQKFAARRRSVGG